MPLVLHEQGGNVASHIGIELGAELSPHAAVAMIYHGGGFVAALPAGGEYAVPHLGILAAARCPGSEPFVETSELGEHLAAKGHIGPHPDVPRWSAFPLIPFHVCRIVDHRSEAEAEPSVVPL